MRGNCECCEIHEATKRWNGCEVCPECYGLMLTCDEEAVHCWEPGPIPDVDMTDAEYLAAQSTCLLPDGHDGSHVFTPDSEIWVLFEGEL